MAVADENDVKGDSLILRAIDQTGDEILFKIKKTTRMGKFFHAFTVHKGLDLGTLRFFCDDGHRIQGDDTPGSLGLKDEDQIEVTSVSHSGFVLDRSGVRKWPSPSDN